MAQNEVKAVIDELMKANFHNLSEPSKGYDRGYAEGYHDALLDVMLGMGIDTDEKHFD